MLRLVSTEIKCSYDELVSIKELKPHPKNPNAHSDEQIARLGKILAYQGFRSPIVVSRNSGFIVAGHGRLLAAKEIGFKEVPVTYQDFADEDQEYAHLVADNAISEWSNLDLSQINLEVPSLGPDFDIDFLGIKDFEIEPADKYEDKDADETPETRKTLIKMGDLYELGTHRLLCGDSTDSASMERLMNGEKADMVYTDPPYGIDEETDRSFRTGLAKGGKFKKIQGDHSIDAAINAFKLIQCPIICYWGGNYFAHELPPSGCWIIWDKRVEEKQRDLNSDCEMAWVKHPTKKSIRIFRHLWKGMIKGSEIGEKRIHPTQKPVALAEWCFKELNSDGSSILDLFAGSGSTLIACEKTNRKFYGLEIDPEYCQVIIDRWEKFTGQKAVKI